VNLSADAREMSEYVYSDSECACSTTYLLPVVRQLLGGFPPGSIVADAGGNGSMFAQLSRPDWEMHGPGDLVNPDSWLRPGRTSPRFTFTQRILARSNVLFP
jgi:hypothetical protein